MPSLKSPVTSALCESRLLFTQSAFCEGSGPFTSRFQLSTVDSRLFPPNSFRFTHFRKNASASPLESHTFKTKDLKPFRFTHFQKKVGWTPCFPPDAHLQSPVTNYRSLRLSPLISALTSRRAPKPFRCNTYKKHTQGEGGCLPTLPLLPLPPLLPRLPVPHQPPLPPLPPRIKYSHVRQAHRH